MDYNDPQTIIQALLGKQTPQIMSQQDMQLATQNFLNPPPHATNISGATPSQYYNLPQGVYAQTPRLQHPPSSYIATTPPNATILAQNKYHILNVPGLQYPGIGAYTNYNSPQVSNEWNNPNPDPSKRLRGRTLPPANSDEQNKLTQTPAFPDDTWPSPNDEVKI